MDIETLYNLKQTKANGKSFAFLAERCEKTTEYPHGFRPATLIASNQTVVLALPGSLSNDRFRECNGFLKRIETFVHSFDEFSNIPCLVAVNDCGKYLSPSKAKELLALSHTKLEKYTAKLQKLPLVEQHEYINPSYVEDIFQTAVLPRISCQDGTIRLPQAQTLRNIRRLNIIAYCDGAYTALMLEQLTRRKMEELRYSQEEQAQILSQLLVLSYSPNIKLGLSQAKTINIASLGDLTIKNDNYFKEFVHFNMFVADIPPIWLPEKNGSTFYCAQYNKNGVEGNTACYRAVDIDNEWLQKASKADLAQDKRQLAIKEHDFLGFEDRPQMSKAAKKLQQYGKNILTAALSNAINQPVSGYRPLPGTGRMAAATLRQKLDLIQYWQGGLIIKRQLKKLDKNELMRHSFAANILTATLD